MTPIERIQARIARLECLLEELRDLRDEIERADMKPWLPAGLVGGAIPPTPDEAPPATPTPEAAPGPRRGRRPPSAAAAEGSPGKPLGGPSYDAVRLRLARLLAERGPLSSEQLGAAADLSRSYVGQLVSGHGWFGRENRLKPWELTPTGRAALAAAPG